MSTRDEGTSSRQVLWEALKSVDLMQQQLSELKRERSEPIAVIGMGCRFPGGVKNPAEFWALLDSGRCAVTETPSERWRSEQFFDPDPDAPGKAYSAWGGFVDGIDQFDAGFFGISPREAVAMDPQQRMLLEVAWEALEAAGVSRLKDTQTGVYLGVTFSDYARVLERAGASAIESYHLSGNALNFAAGRLAYALGLRGPCMALDTACSSSLVALHLACQSLRQNETDMALCGGVNALLAPEWTIATSKARMLSPTGLCRTFDSAADGYVRGEGCGVLVLKRLSDARQNGDRVLAVIRATAVNHDGASSGLTVPNGKAQESLLLKAVEGAGIDPCEVDYVEAHGTGTALGDPIELAAIDRAFNRGRSSETPLVVGSVKTNIGHLESAAGIAGVIKTILSLQHETIPPHLHLRKLNPHLAESASRLVIPTVARAWPRGTRRRFAGVSSFGGSGTNAHVVLTEADDPPAQLDRGRKVYLLPVSGHTHAALAEAARQLGVHLEANQGLELADVERTLTRGRVHQRERLAVVVRDTAEASQRLLDAAEPSGRTVEVTHGSVAPGARAKIGMLFGGQGLTSKSIDPWLWNERAFRETLQECSDICSESLGRKLDLALYGEGAGQFNADETRIAQPAWFALAYAQWQFWRSLGVSPDFVVGHSLGEFVAACVAGTLDMRTCLRLVIRRGRLMQDLCLRGKMVAVSAPRERVIAALHASDGVEIAAFNGPSSIVLSGTDGGLRRVLQSEALQGVRTKPLPGSFAFHSRSVEPFLDDWQRYLDGITWDAPSIPIASTLTGELIDRPGVYDSEYWRRHAREPVQFERALKRVYDEGCRIFIECGPSPSLSTLGRQMLPDVEVAWLSSHRADCGAEESVVQNLAELFVRGAKVDWSARVTDGAMCVSLPSYPFQRKRFWPSPASPSEPLGEGHPLIGRELVVANADAVYDVVWSDDFEYLGEHKVYGEVVVPGACQASMALVGARGLLKTERLQLSNVVFREALVLRPGQPRKVQIVFESLDGTRTFRVLSRSTGAASAAPWVLHASGVVDAGGEAPSWAREVDFSRETEVAAGDFYAGLARRGVELGPRFRWIERIHLGQKVALAELRAPEEADVGPYILHPGLLDSCFQSLANGVGSVGFHEDAYVPLEFERLQVFGRPSGGSLRCRATLTEPVTGTAELIRCDLELTLPSGKVVAQVSGLSLKRAPAHLLVGSEQRNSRRLEALYATSWIGDVLPEPRHDAERTHVLVVDSDGDGGRGALLAAELRGRGHRCTLARCGSGPGVLEQDEYVFEPTSARDWDWLISEVSIRSVPSTVVNLLPLGELDMRGQHWLSTAIETTVGSTLRLVQAVQRSALRARPPRLIVVTAGAQAVGGHDVLEHTWARAGVWGACRVLTSEMPDLDCFTLDIEAEQPQEDIACILREVFGRSQETEAVWRNGRRFVPRLVRAKKAGSRRRPFRIGHSGNGVLDGIRVEEGLRPPAAIPRDEVKIAVRAAGLNFRDVLNALDVYPGDAGSIGAEASGVVVEVGQEVSDLAPGDGVYFGLRLGAMATTTNVKAALVVKQPRNVDFVEASTIPVAFLTALYGLEHLAKLTKGQSVLIHCAAGAVGSAAVQIAMRIGATVYATASEAKRNFVQGSGAIYVGSSRSFEWAARLRELTAGAGVDVILNSLTGEHISRGLEALKSDGWFIEIGKRELLTRDEVGKVRRDVRYAHFDLIEIANESPHLVGAMLTEITSRVERGELRALTHRVFSAADPKVAFKYMAQARHVGKVVLTGFDVARPNVAPVDETGGYLITGGWGGLGLQVAEWLVKRGAKNLVLAGRSKPSQGAAEKIQQLEATGTRIITCSVDVSSLSAVRNLVQFIDAEGMKLCGIVHAAGVVKDGTVAEQDIADVQGVMSGKLEGAWNLHLTTIGKSLGLFVLFSSAAAQLGQSGQALYAAANASLASLSQYRRSRGLPSLCIDWGPWVGDGMFGRLSDGERRRIEHRGLHPMSGDVALGLMEQALCEVTDAQVMAAAIDWARYADSPSVRLPTRLAELVPRARSSGHGGRSVPSSRHLRETLTASTVAERGELVEAYLGQRVKDVLGISQGESIDCEQPLAEIGMDSLTMVELRGVIARDLDTPMPAALLYEYPTISKLCEFLVGGCLSDIDFGSEASSLVRTSMLVTKADQILDDIENMAFEELTAGAEWRKN